MAVRESSINCLAEKTVFFFDGDGTLLLDNHLLPGAANYIHQLQDESKHVIICTNNSSKTAATYSEKYARLGIHLPEHHVITSLQPAIHYFKSKQILRLAVMGNRVIMDELSNEGFELTFDAPQAVLLTYDTELTYDKYARITRLIQQGTPYFLTHPDMVCPTQEGPLPDLGVINAGIEQCTHYRPTLVFGKPNIQMIEPTLLALNASLSDAVFFGDRLYTDIAMSQDTPLTSVLTLTGETTWSMYTEQSIKADLVIDSLEDLLV